MTLEAQAGGGLLELAARCEAAAGPDRELDTEIAVAALGFFAIPPKYEGGAVGYGYVDSEGRDVHPGHGGKQLVREFTASIDAALTLVREGEHHWPQLVFTGTNPNNPKQRCRAELWHKGSKPSRSNAATLALAICAASLRARAAIQLAEGR